ncbi:hypothetical protein TNCV_4358861 [Trichonephila clavipes]|nr:hypothetical protein TNCV_4358861 [Trichonephila clavipes]
MMDRISIYKVLAKRNEIDIFLKRMVTGLEADPCQAEVARSLQVARKWYPGCGINSKQVVLTPGRDCPLRLASSLACPFDCIQQERQDICGTANISGEHHNNGCVFFSVMSRNSPDYGILVESSSGESGAYFHPFYVIKIDRFHGKGILVCRGIMWGRRTPLYVFDVSTVYSQR